MTLDFIFDKYDENADADDTVIEFTCSFEGPIPSKSEVLDNLALYFDFNPECAKIEKFRPVKGKGQVKGKVIINR